MASTEAYEGQQPYAFISYAHKDNDLVLPIIRDLQAAGFRVWYDAGIEAGSEWPEYIAAHLKKSACVLAFISESFVASPNCRRELTFGQNTNVPMLNVFLDDVDLSDGMRMQLGLNQCVYYGNYQQRADFIAALCRSPLLLSCQGGEASGTVSPEPVQRASATPDAPNAQEKTESSGLFRWFAWLVESAHVWLGAIVMNALTMRTSNVLALLIVTFLVHFGISAVTRRGYKSFSKRMTPAQRNDASDTWNTACVLCLFISIIVSCFYLHCTYRVFFKILVSIGLHLIPALVCMGALTPDLPSSDKKS